MYRFSLLDGNNMIKPKANICDRENSIDDKRPEIRY